MTQLSEQYDRQRAWRDYDTVYDLLGPIESLHIADLGCGSGAVSSDLVSRGANVIGVDSHSDLIIHAEQRVPKAQFVNANIEEPGKWSDKQFDLIWCSFAVAYLSNPTSVMSKWRTLAKPGSRLVAIEMADLFAHQPLSDRDRNRLKTYEHDVIKSGEYHFDAAHRLGSWVRAAGWQVQYDLDLRDAELCANGACSEDVLQSWSDRIARMPRLGAAIGSGFARRFMECLASETHSSDTRVRCIVATT